MAFCNQKMFVSKTWYKEVTILTVISFAIEFAVGFVIGLALVSVDQVYLFQTDIFAIYEAIVAVVIFTGLAIWRIRKKTVTVKEVGFTFETGTRNIQNNKCTNSFRCFNDANGNDNTQTNRCESIGLFGCFNQVNGNDNTQTNECNSVGAFCQNAAVGNDNIQTVLCERMNLCFNNAQDSNSNTQSTACE